ncbi:CopG family transcriptional regulator [Verrucomicrobia bacterium]|nr:CopG family transcriptional regulator [Verrucomicrobiota bacterium]MDB4665135.1 CopG family transcriptional regulator [Verrucomicrobiota bacterium]
MRIIIKIPDTMLHKLDIAGEKQKCSRAAIIRETIDAFLDRNTQISDLNQSLGLWKNKVSDRLSYQENLRKEWPTQ